MESSWSAISEVSVATTISEGLKVIELLIRIDVHGWIELSTVAAQVPLVTVIAYVLNLGL
jgi:hypothetical protein